MTRKTERERSRIQTAATILVVIVLSSCVIAGVVISSIGAWRIRQGLASNTWPKTEGTIVESRVVREFDPGSGSGSAQSIGSTTHRASVRYTYVVRSTTFTGTRITVADTGSSDAGIADSLVRKYAAGNDVTVFYDPRDPSIAVLERGVPLAAYLLIVAGAFFVFVPVALVGVGRSRLRKADRNKTRSSNSSNSTSAAKGLPSGSRLRVLPSETDEFVLLVPAGRAGVETTGWLGGITLGLSCFFGVFFLPDLLNRAASPGLGAWIVAAGFGAAGLLGVVLLLWWLRLRFESAVVRIGRDDIRVERRILGLRRSERSVYVDDPRAIQVLNHEDNGVEIMDVMIDGADPGITFATSLSPAEKRWLVEAINRFLASDSQSASG